MASKTPIAPADIYREKVGMGIWEHRGKVAVAGVGHAPTDRRWDERAETSMGAYAILAIRKAIEEAGIEPSQVDGLIVVRAGTTGDAWAPRPIPESFSQRFKLTDNLEDGITTLSVEWLLANMPELTGISMTMHTRNDCMSNAVVLTSQVVGDGLAKNCIVVKGWANPAGRYGHGGINAQEAVGGSAQWTHPWGFVSGIPLYGFEFNQYCAKYNSNHDRMAPFVVNQRKNGMLFPEGFYAQHPTEGTITVDDYLAARWISKPMSLLDCDRPIQSAGAYLFTTGERARDMKQPPVYILNHSSTRWNGRSGPMTLDEVEQSTDLMALKTYEGAGIGPDDVDIFNPYDGYTLFTQYYLEAFKWRGVQRGEGHDFYQEDISVHGPNPFSSSGGNNGSGRTRYWMHTDCIQQLRGQAGARQVTTRADIGISGGPTPGGGDWTVWSKSPDV